MQAVSSELKNILAEIFKINELKPFYLAGGTALALKYAHRISTDIDLFAEIDFEDKNKTLEILEQNFGGRFEINSESRYAIRGKIDGVKTDFLFWKQIKEMLKPVEVFENFRLASDEDISAMKVSAIINRGTRKDFYDMAFLVKKLGLKNIIVFYQKKYNISSDAEAIRYLGDFFEADLEGENAVEILNFPFENWDEVKNFIKKELSLYITNKE